MSGSLFLVATPIGNLEDITLRALRVLKQVDLIAAEDTRRTGHLLTHFGITTKTTSLHEHNEKTRVPGLIQRVREGLQLAVVTDAGMPSVSDPGYLIVREAIRSEVKVEVIPGVSALTTALAGSGLPTDQFLFLGFAPSRSGERKRWLTDRVGPAAGTVVLFEAPGRLRGLLGDLEATCGDRYVVVAHELTKVHESWHRGNLSDLTDAGLSPGLPERGEFVVLVSNQKAEGGTKGSDPFVPDETEVAALFARISQDSSVSRREALNQVAATYAMSNRAVYAIVERFKVSGK
jgi:16S rRNA (cytidine1402-2'-O)-methyltransferase